MAWRRPGERFKHGSGGSGVVWCRPVDRSSKVGWSGAGQLKRSSRVPQVPGWCGAGQVQGSSKVPEVRLKQGSEIPYFGAGGIGVRRVLWHMTGVRFTQSFRRCQSGLIHARVVFGGSVVVHV